MQSIATKSLPPLELTLDSSFGSRDAGKHASTLELFQRDDGTYFLEWDIPGLERVVGMNITVDGHKRVTDYDGNFSIPRPAVPFLRAQGFIVPRDCY